MGSAAAPKHYFWRSPMAKTSLVHRFTQVLLNPSKEASNAKVADEEDEGEDCVPSPASNLTSQRRRRLRLEMDVERLQERLHQETELHSALENAISRVAGAFSTFPRNLPVHAQELLADVAMLEVAVSNLEEQMIGLEMQIQYERNARLRSAARQIASPVLPKRKGPSHQQVIADRLNTAINLAERPSLHERMAGKTMEPVWEDGLAQSNNISHRLEEEVSAQCYNIEKVNDTMNSTQEASTIGRYMDSDAEDNMNKCQSSHESVTNGAGNDHPDDALRDTTSQMHRVEHEGASSSSDDSIQGKLDKLWKHPNRLSQEMVSCMIGIYCHLADPLDAGKKIIADNLPSPSSPFGYVTSSSFSSLSDLSNMSFAKSPPYEPKVKEEQSVQNNADPYRTPDRVEWGEIGSYSLAIEVSWMSVGKEQLEYAADALRLFRSLVEQLSRVDAMSLNHNEKLAFWINIYNALMMHAYLAYGVPKNDVKYFALMQKAAYTVGGHFFNAMAIEHVLLRGKAPSYRPQIALLLALHKVKIPEGASKLAISRPEPLVTFALSCGAWSSPAVRIYTPENVQVQLQAALHEYVRASVGISRHGKVLIPKLLHCYGRELNSHKERGETSEGCALVTWLCTFLPACQATLVRDVVQQRADSPSASASTLISVQPFNFRLRYLFLHQLRNYHKVASMETRQ